MTKVPQKSYSQHIHQRVNIPNIKIPLTSWGMKIKKSNRKMGKRQEQKFTHLKEIKMFSNI